MARNNHLQLQVKKSDILGWCNLTSLPIERGLEHTTKQLQYQRMLWERVPTYTTASFRIVDDSNKIVG
jgi:hypothetical protein